MPGELCECPYHRAKRDGDLDKFQLKQSTYDTDDAISNVTFSHPRQQSTKWKGTKSKIESFSEIKNKPKKRQR